MPEISIIVPVYNVEKYLPRCVDSILNQTFTNFELILVDDGSTDRSGIICDQYKKRDNRIKVIHKINEGVSKARNIGISEAKGRYIEFIDSDDWIERSLLEDTLKQIRIDNSDIIFFGILYEDEDDNLIKEKKYVRDEVIEKEKSKLAIELYNKDLFGYTWCKLFKNRIIKDNNILFNNDISYCEDEEFTCRYFKYVKKISICSNTYYHYIHYSRERKSLTESVNSKDIIMRDLVYKSWIDMLNFNDNEEKDYLLNRAYNNLRFLYCNIVWSNISQECKNNEIDILLQTNFYNYLKNNGQTFKYKYLLYMIKHKNINLFKVLAVINSKIRRDKDKNG